VRGTDRAYLRNVLFEVAPEESARRVAEALVAAESGDPDAWRWLNDGALFRLRSDADAVASLVPHAFLMLTEQLAAHARSAVRIDAVRYASLLAWYSPETVARLLHGLANDASRGVSRAARQALEPFQPSPVVEQLASADLVEVV
jgi:hypothetical protein